MTTRTSVLLLVIAGLALAPAAHAQYFGRNKVQYETFEFKVLATEHFDIYYDPEEAAAVQLAARMAETDHVLGHELVHAFQFDMANRRDAEGNLAGPAVLALPL